MRSSCARSHLSLFCKDKHDYMSLFFTVGIFETGRHSYARERGVVDLLFHFQQCVDLGDDE